MGGQSMVENCPITISTVHTTIHDIARVANHGVEIKETFCCLKKNKNTPRPSEHPPVRGKNCQNV